jgi:TonB family protein
MKYFMKLGRICSRARLVLMGGLTLLCISCLLAGDVKRVLPDEAMKAVTYRTKVQYNAIANQLRLSGSVGLDVVIAEDGTVESATVVRGNPVLGNLATEAVKHWKFTPFKSDGKAIKVISEIVIQFTYGA